MIYSAEYSIIEADAAEVADDENRGEHRLYLPKYR